MKQFKAFRLCMPLIFLLLVLCTGFSFGQSQEALYGERAASENGWTYYINDQDHGRIYKINDSNDQVSKVSDVQASRLLVKDGWIYYLANSDFYSQYGNIYRMQVDGSNIQAIVDVGDHPLISNLAFYNEQVYYSKNAGVHRINVDGTSYTELFTSRDLLGQYSYRIGGRYLFIHVKRLLIRVDLFTLESYNHEMVFSMKDIAADKDWVYCAQEYGDEDTLFKLDHAFTEFVPISSEFTSVGELNLKDGYLYGEGWDSKSKETVVFKMDLETKTSRIITNADFSNLCVTDKRLYGIIYSHLGILNLDDPVLYNFTSRPVDFDMVVLYKDLGLIYNTTKGIYFKKLTGEEIKLTDNRCNDILIDGDRLFYKNRSGNRNLHVYNLLTHEDYALEGTKYHYLVSAENNLLYYRGPASEDDEATYLFKISQTDKSIANAMNMTAVGSENDVIDGLLYKHWYRPINSHEAVLTVEFETDIQKEIIRRPVYSMIVVGDIMYYVDTSFFNRSIYKNTITGGNEKAIYTAKKGRRVSMLYLDGSDLYFEECTQNYGEQKIYKMDLTTGEKKLIVDLPVSLLGKLGNNLIVDAGVQLLQADILEEGISQVDFLKQAKIE